MDKPPESKDAEQARKFLKVYQEMIDTQETNAKQLGYALAALEKTKHLLKPEEYKRFKKAFEQGQKAFQTVANALKFENRADYENPDKIAERYNRALPAIQFSITSLFFGVKVQDLQTKIKKDKKFEAFEKAFGVASEAIPGAFTNFSSFLILSVQAGPRYRLLHNELVKNKSSRLSIFDEDDIKEKLTQVNEYFHGISDLDKALPVIEKLLQFCAKNPNLAKLLKSHGLDQNSLAAYGRFKECALELDKLSVLLEADPDNKMLQKNAKTKVLELRKLASMLEKNSEKIKTFINNLQALIRESDFNPFQSRFSFKKHPVQGKMEDLKRDLSQAEVVVPGVITHLKALVSRAEVSSLGSTLRIQIENPKEMQGLISDAIIKDDFSSDAGKEHLFLSPKSKGSTAKLYSRNIAEIACNAYVLDRKAIFRLDNLSPEQAIQAIQYMMQGTLKLASNFPKSDYQIPATHIELSDKLEAQLRDLPQPDKDTGGADPAWWYYHKYLPELAHTPPPQPQRKHPRP